MKSVKVKIFALFCLSLVSAIVANAQVCGKYRTSVTVQTALGKPIENAVVQFLPITKDETRGNQFVRDAADLSKFTVTFTEGDSLKNFHRLIISADGYKTAENEIKFDSCRGHNVIVKLAESDSNAAAVWDFQVTLDISAMSAGKDLDHAKLIIFDGDKKIEEDEMKLGYVYIHLPSGKYKFRFEEKGYQSKEMQMDLTKITDMSLKINLKCAE